MFLLPAISRPTGTPREHTPLRHTIAMFAARIARAKADPSGTHPSFLVFLLFLVAWFMGESIPSEDADSMR
jgi:hypothetical protein